MSDFLTRLASEDAPEAREVTIGGETGTAWFRHLSSGERETMLRGMKISHAPGKGGTIEIDLGENEKQRQMLVQFSVCDESGKRLFKNLDAVKKLPHDRLMVLAHHAEDVNRESDDLGKS